MTPRILYEDRDLVVAEKPVNVVTEGELPGLLRSACGELFVVHRLDRGVGGAILLAKSSRAAAVLTEALREGGFQKQYDAVVHGCPPEPAGEWTDLLYHDPRSNKSFVVKRPRRGVRDARLSYEVRESVAWEGPGPLTLVRVRLGTGRTHQIRVQFAHRQLPLAGDRRYGARDRFSTVALWSSELSFPHPHSGERVTVVCRPPEAPPWTLFRREAAE